VSVDEFGLAADLRAAADTRSQSPGMSAVRAAAESGNEAETERLERLHERLVSEHVHSTDELVACRRQFTEIAEEHARVQQSISALEARLEDEELVLSLIAAKLRELARS
jgi:hypothetical protein